MFGGFFYTQSINQIKETQFYEKIFSCEVVYSFKQQKMPTCGSVSVSFCIAIQILTIMTGLHNVHSICYSRFSLKHFWKLVKIKCE